MPGGFTEEQIRAAIDAADKLPPTTRPPILSRGTKRALQIRRFKKAAELMEEYPEMTWEDAFERADRDCYGIACSLG